MQVIVLKDHRENPKKCSILPLKRRKGLKFVNLQDFDKYNFSGLTLLHPDGKLVKKISKSEKILLVDANWGRAKRTYNRLLNKYELKKIKIDGWKTAYPYAKSGNNPANTLASAEALFVVYLMAGRYDESVLKFYRWREEFLKLNRTRIKQAVAQKKTL